MHVVGHHISQGEPSHVHTIDIWFSERRGAWIVERLNGDGHQIGAACLFNHEQDARDCVDDWLRAHRETELVGSPQRRPTAAQAVKPRRRAA